MSDYFDDAMNATYTERPKLVFGQVDVDVWPCVLVKGTGKVLFDATQHKAEDRCTAIHITIAPTTNSRMEYKAEREMIAESKEWAGIMKPSLVALSTDLRSVKGKWVKASLVPTGRKYTNAAGETKQATTFKFEAVYNTEAECEAAEEAVFGKSDSSATAPNGSASGNGNTPHPNGNGSNGNGNNPLERETALKFLPALWTSAGKDLEKFAASLAKNPLVSKYFDLNSPEVIHLIQAA